MVHLLNVSTGPELETSSNRIFAFRTGAALPDGDMLGRREALELDKKGHPFKKQMSPSIRIRILHIDISLYKPL